MKKATSEIERIRNDWEDLAEIDGAWFNVPAEQLREQGWDMHAFMESGRSHVEKDVEMLASVGIVPRGGCALDFGCGLGRLTQALSAYYDVCYGVDISSKMIARAKQLNTHGDRCRFLENPASDLNLFRADTFDLVYAENVLQHVPPEIIRNYLREFGRVMKAGATFVFQIPLRSTTSDERTRALRKLPRYHPRRVLNKIRSIVVGAGPTTRYYRLRRLGLSKQWLYRRFGLHPHINMYCMDEGELTPLLEGLGLQIVHVVRYTYGPMLHSKWVARQT